MDEEAEPLGRFCGTRAGQRKIRWALYSETASAIALSRHRLSVLNSSTVKGASRSTARSVMAWHKSP